MVNARYEEDGPHSVWKTPPLDSSKYKTKKVINLAEVRARDLQWVLHWDVRD